MINGTHVVVYSKDAEADRAFFRDILNFRSVNVGHGWLIFGLPPSEAAVHPAGENDRHELYLMCSDLSGELTSLREKGVQCEAITEAAWGSVTKIRLPGGGKIALYEPKPPRP